MKCKHDLIGISEGLVTNDNTYVSPVFKCKKCLKYFVYNLCGKPIRDYLIPIEIK